MDMDTSARTAVAVACPLHKHPSSALINRPTNFQEDPTMKNFIKDEAGQTATEYMLIISVVVIAVVAAAYTFVPTFQSGVQDLANDVKTILAHGKIGSAGTSRN